MVYIYLLYYILCNNMITFKYFPFFIQFVLNQSCNTEIIMNKYNLLINKCMLFKMLKQIIILFSSIIFQRDIFCHQSFEVYNEPSCTLMRVIILHIRNTI